jgi:hypothetical protein
MWNHQNHENTHTYCNREAHRFFDTTVKTIETVSNWNNHKNFKNHSQEITLHLWTQYFGLIALSTVFLVWLSADTALTLVLNSVLHRCTLPLTPHCAHIGILPFLTLSRLALCYITHWLALTRLYISCHALALYGAISISQTFYTVLVTAGYPFSRICYLLLVWEGSGILAALMSEASWLGRLLGAVALYYNMHL